MEMSQEEEHKQKEPLLQIFLAKTKLIPGLLRFMIPLGLVYLFEYFINQGLVCILMKFPKNM